MFEWLQYKRRLQTVRSELVESRKTLEPLLSKKKQTADVLALARACDKLAEVLIRTIDSLPGKA
jgi:hypothetical protein